MYIERSLAEIVRNRMFRGKAIIVLGARQVGKSTLLKHLTEHTDQPILSLNCDDPDTRRLLGDISAVNLRLLVGSRRIIMIDEAQRVADIGMTIKRIVDQYPDVQVLATGSSALNLRSAINEPLTGRKYEYIMYPLSTAEIYHTFGLSETRQLLDSRLIFGSYPDIITHLDEATELLAALAESYLYKDILELEDVRKPTLLQKLLVALSLQVGSEVSFNEVASITGSDPKTVEKYVDLLEKCYVVYSLHGLSRNLRNELKKTRKIFFYDTGVRNAIIQNYAPSDLRSDMGALWENFFITERIKFNAYSGRNVNYYFWRTTSQQEIDFIEECDGHFTVFEMKWNPKAKASFPKSFMETYKPEHAYIVTPENYLEHLITP